MEKSQNYSVAKLVTMMLVLFVFFLLCFFSISLADHLNLSVKTSSEKTQFVSTSSFEHLGPPGKWRILVDKVLMKQNNWVMTEDHVLEIKEAGFNIISPRKGGTESDRVRHVSRLAQKHGMYYVAWMRGSIKTDTGLKYVHADGSEQSMYSPNADELWAWMTRIVLEHARISLEIPSMIGTFFDFENYGPRKRGKGDLYQLSYDAVIIKKFFEGKSTALPDFLPAEREPWLRENGLLKEFSSFQINYWRMKAKKLRKQVDAINPHYLMILYPAPGTLFMTEALYLEWATAQAPLVLADASTYGKPMNNMPDVLALAANKKRLSGRFRTVKKRHIPVLYLGGIDPIVRGATPEFCGKNASMISEVTDGYWVFYEGPEYDGEHPEYFKRFKEANEDILSRDHSNIQ